jgi:hypothetical protein
MQRKTKMRCSALVCLTSALLFQSAANATLISYEVTNLAGNSWEYTYTVVNDTLGVDIEEFSIFFGLESFANLTIGSTPADWDPLVLQPDPSLPDDGLYDALALAIGIAPGALLGGFSVQFDFLGVGTPGQQFFQVVDAATFGLLDSGFTVRNVTSVPEPGTAGLMALGIAVLAGLRRRRSSGSARQLIVMPGAPKTPDASAARRRAQHAIGAIPR